MQTQTPVRAPFAVLFTLTALITTLINTLTTPVTALQLLNVNIQITIQYIITWSALLALLFTFTDTYITATTTPTTRSHALIPLHVILTTYVLLHAVNISPTTTSNLVVLTCNVIACLIYLLVYIRSQFQSIESLYAIFPLNEN